jgi:hypothetical protein
MIFNLQTGRAQPFGRQSSEGRAEPTAKIPYCKYRAPDATPRFVPIRDTGHVGGRTRYSRESLFDPLLGKMHVLGKISWLSLSADWPEIARRPVLGLRSTFLLAIRNGRQSNAGRPRTALQGLMVQGA